MYLIKLKKNTGSSKTPCGRPTNSHLKAREKMTSSAKSMPCLSHSRLKYDPTKLSLQFSSTGGVMAISTDGKGGKKKTPEKQKPCAYIAKRRKRSSRAGSKRKTLTTSTIVDALDVLSAAAEDLGSSSTVKRRKSASISVLANAASHL